MNPATIIALAITTAYIAVAITMIAIVTKGIANMRRESNHHEQQFQAHINELIEDLERTTART